MAVDPFAAQVTCRLNFEGLENFPGYADDVSPLRQPPKSFGACMSTRGDKAFGEFSRMFNPSGENTGYLALSATGICDFGLGDYTIEGRSKIVSAGRYHVLFATGNYFTPGYTDVVVSPSGAIYTGLFDGAARPVISSADAAINAGVWFEWRVVRASGVGYLFLRGGLVGEPTAINISITSTDPRVGMSALSPEYCFQGFLDEFVITKAARGTTSYTPGEPYDYTPSASLGLTTLGALASKVDYPPPAFAARHLAPVAAHSTLKSPGIGTLTGTVKEKASPTNRPLSRRVILLRHSDDHKVAEGWSDAAGNYTFTGIDHRLDYYVVSFDHTGKYRAVIADRQTPTVS